MPPESISKRAELPPYPPADKLGDRRLNVTLFPLDITTPHTLSHHALMAKTKPLITAGSPLAEWVDAFLGATFKKSDSLYIDTEAGVTASDKYDLEVPFHDPVCIWYALTTSAPSPGPANSNHGWTIKHKEDIRVETLGQWTRGMYVVDRRGRQMVDTGADGEGAETSADNGDWLSVKKGNRLGRCVGTPGVKGLEEVLLGTLFEDVK